MNRSTLIAVALAVSLSLLLPGPAAEAGGRRCRPPRCRPCPPCPPCWPCPDRTGFHLYYCIDNQWVRQSPQYAYEADAHAKGEADGRTPVRCPGRCGPDDPLPPLPPGRTGIYTVCPANVNIEGTKCIGWGAAAASGAAAPSPGGK